MGHGVGRSSFSPNAKIVCELGSASAVISPGDALCRLPEPTSFPAAGPCGSESGGSPHSAPIRPALGRSEFAFTALANPLLRSQPFTNCPFHFSQRTALSFQSITNCFFRNSNLRSELQTARGWGTHPDLLFRSISLSPMESADAEFPRIEARQDQPNQLREKSSAATPLKE